LALVDGDLPRVTPSLLRRADDMCRRRLAREHAGGKRYANKGSDARFAISNRITNDARLAHAELGPPRAEAFVDPAELEPEQQRLYRAAVAGYLALFGETPCLSADLGWRTVLSEHEVELVGDVGLAVELPDGTRELRGLKFGSGGVRIDPTDVAVALVRTAEWAPEQLRITVADLLSLECETYEPDVAAERERAAEWVSARVEIVKRHAQDARPSAGSDCNGCAFISGCKAHA
jgi:hypothetical protein